jgi:hypothetical protein
MPVWNQDFHLRQRPKTEAIDSPQGLLGEYAWDATRLQVGFDDLSLEIARNHTYGDKLIAHNPFP